ncbi:hypothetical protein V6N13_004382 [Hibiscus sabdariffa]|uniref:Uncharacterized protein n=1 Tax=Hibiscus sabdariffa TaxID=183260 RepID=A0ABR2RYW2_9ROSI
MFSIAASCFHFPSRAKTSILLPCSLFHQAFRNRAASPALRDRLDYTLVWKSNEGNEGILEGCSLFWLLQPPEGYKSNGALMFRKGDLAGEPIDANGSNLPGVGCNDGEFRIDLPSDGQRKTIKLGNLASAKPYVHVKPALGGTFTDIAMWILCPFNGPATRAIGIMNIALCKIGQQGYAKPGIGIRNDCASSNFYFLLLNRNLLQPSISEMVGKTIFGELPVELYGEEVPTAPKGKNNWVDERG